MFSASFFWQTWDVLLASSYKRLDFDGDPDQDVELGILKGFLPSRNRGCV